MRGFLFFLCLIVTPLNFAHEGRPVYIELIQDNSSDFLLKWKIPPVMASHDEPVINLSGNGCEIFSGHNSKGLIGKKLYRCAQTQDLDDARTQLLIKINYPGENPALSSLIIFQRLEGEVIELFNGPEETQIPLPREATPSSIALQYLIGGTQHILVGFDHLLFILCLIVIAGNPRRIIIAITGFTIAHSITLALASLNLVRVSVPIVEVLIALSIAILAAEIIKDKRNTLAWRYPLSIACVFGLLHGFGFASVLADLGLPYAMKLNALIFFNAGVELGQIIFVMAVLTLMTAFRRLPLANTMTIPATQICLFIVGSISMYWLVERCLHIMM